MNNYRLPAEWEPHESTWLIWPQNKDTWYHGFEKVWQAYSQFVSVISKGEKVNICINEELKPQVADLLDQKEANLSAIEWHHIPTNDSWMRDCGPDFLLDEKNKKVKLLDWQYNAWGGKYPPYDDDNNIPSYVAEKLGLEKKAFDFVLEGGSFDPNGNGTILTTKSCLLNPNRNPSYSQSEIENLLSEAFNLKNILWLEEGITGDDTDGHIDDITRFTSEDTVVTSLPESAKHTDFTVLSKNLKILEDYVKRGILRDIEVIPVPDTPMDEDIPLPGSYANFYICNAGIILPVFGTSQDAYAIKKMRKIFKGRPVFPIYSGDIILGLGSFHCLSKHQPALP